MVENLEKYLVKLTEKIPDIGCRLCDGAEEEMPQKSLEEETKILNWIVHCLGGWEI